MLTSVCKRYIYTTCEAEYLEVSPVLNEVRWKGRPTTRSYTGLSI